MTTLNIPSKFIVSHGMKQHTQNVEVQFRITQYYRKYFYSDSFYTCIVFSLLYNNLLTDNTASVQCSFTLDKPEMCKLKKNMMQFITQFSKY